MPDDKKIRPYLPLGDLLPYDHFRTVESFEMAKAASEMRVELGLKPPFMEKLAFALPWDGALLGYARKTPAMEELCRREEIEFDRAELYMNDWGDRFLMTLDDEAGRKSFSFYVTPGEMKELLEKCCKIPAHNKPREIIKIKKRKNA